MKGGFRTRLTVTIILLVVATAGLLSLGSFLLVRSSLRDQLVDEALARAEFNLVVLAEAEGLPTPLSRPEFESTRLADRILLRGDNGLFVDFGDGDPYASHPDLLDTPDLTDPELTGLATEGRYGFQFVSVGGDAMLVVAGRRPSSREVYYFFTDASVVRRAAADLGRYLGAAAISVIALAGLAAGTVARGVLRPVDSAGRAAQKIAAGELGTRVSVTSDDEFGRLADTFNQMAESLQIQVSELEEAEARERRFVADVSHELRTPLTGLFNEAQLLEQHLDEMTGTGRRAAELLVVDLSRLRRLVDELLEISRLDASPAEADLVPTDIGRLLDAVVADRFPDADVTGEAPEQIGCDRRGVERVVANLLDNASVHAPGAAVAVRYRYRDGELEIHIEDDGPGVGPDSLPHIFDRFFKADPSRQGGSGLGLAIARRHARRMGGDLTVEARPMRGLVFELRVPVTIPLQTHTAVDTLETDADGEK